MTDDSASNCESMPAIVPFVLNAVLATGLGAFVGGWPGAAIAFALLVSVFALFWLVGWSGSDRGAISRLREAILRPLRPVLGLILLPVVMVLMIPAVAIYSAWLGAERSLQSPKVRPLAPLARTTHRFALFVASGFTPRSLPGTALNFLLVLILASVVIGIEVAFYAALSAVPVMLVTLMMVAIESSREPEE